MRRAMQLGRRLARESWRCPRPRCDAPILIRRAARSATSGSRAAFSMTVSPRASTAAISRSSVPVTRDAVERERRARQAVRRLGFDITVLLRDARAQPLQSGDVQIDGPRADRATARHRHASAPASRHQRPQHQARSAHGFYEFIGSFGMLDCGCLDLDAAVFARHARTDVSEQLLHRRDIADRRNPIESDAIGASEGTPPAPAKPSSWRRSPAISPSSGTPP